MDYYKIGQRIRALRKANHLSQDQLAERVGISTTHMSHIETGNTKLSLTVLVQLATVLSVQTDELLFDAPQINTTTSTHQINELLDTCSAKELYVIIDVIKTMKLSLDKHYSLSDNN